MTRWELVPPCPAGEVAQLSRSLGISPLLATLLAQRGYREPQAARRFLSPQVSDLNSPFAFRSMERAVRRLHLARERHERVGVFGDYDVDGITSTALLVLAFKSYGLDVIYRLPERLSEGYGLTHTGVADLITRGAKLLVTVDCGITAHEEIAWAQSHGVDTIVCDHHLPSDTLPPALAMLNPKLSSEGYAFAELAGVGVALKLAQALTGELDPGWLELAALGTVADVAPLVEENRILVACGLRAMRFSRFPGLRALLAQAGLDPEQLGTGQLSFRVAPRLNALGRLGNASPAVELFLTEDESEAARLACLLEQENGRRQACEAQVLAEAVSQVEEQANLEDDFALVVAGERWHPGVLGIVAARLVERWYRPALVISLEGEKGKGSGRSIPAFSLYNGLKKASPWLLQFGGHRLAAGFSLLRSNLAGFRDAFLTAARSALTPEDLVPCQRIDIEVRLDELDLKTVAELELMAPFGRGNPEPVLLARNLRAVRARQVGQGQEHLRLDLSLEGRRISGIGFGLGNLFSSLTGGAVDVVFSPGVEEWQGLREVELKIKDIRTAARPVELHALPPQETAPRILDFRGLELLRPPDVCSTSPTLILREPPVSLAELEADIKNLPPNALVCLLFGDRELAAGRSTAQARYPDRDFLARLYLCLKAQGTQGLALDLIARHLAAQPDKVRRGLAVLEELSLVKHVQTPAGVLYHLNRAALGRRIDLKASRTFRQFEQERRRELAVQAFLARTPAPVLAAFFTRLWLRGREVTKSQLIC